MQMFKEDKTAAPLIPHDAWLSTLRAHEAHKANHEGVAGTLLRMRLAKKVADSCVVCRKARARLCQQIMSDLPP